MKRLRIATAALVTRGSGHDVEVLVVRRAPELRFFGGYWAFPGGVVDEADHDGELDHDVPTRAVPCASCTRRSGWWRTASARSMPDCAAVCSSATPRRRARSSAWHSTRRRGAGRARRRSSTPVARLTTRRGRLRAPVLYLVGPASCTREAPAGFEPDVVPGDHGSWTLPPAPSGAARRTARDSSWGRRRERLVGLPLQWARSCSSTSPCSRTRRLEAFLDADPRDRRRPLPRPGGCTRSGTCPVSSWRPSPRASSSPPATTTNADIWSGRAGSSSSTPRPPIRSSSSGCST